MAENTITGILITLILGAYGMMSGIIWKMFHNNRNVVSPQEFTKHKEAVQYKDNCGEIVKRIENKIDGAVEILSIKLDHIDQNIERGKE